MSAAVTHVLEPQRAALDSPPTYERSDSSGEPLVSDARRADAQRAERRESANAELTCALELSSRGEESGSETAEPACAGLRSGFAARCVPRLRRRCRGEPWGGQTRRRDK